MVRVADSSASNLGSIPDQVSEVFVFFVLNSSKLMGIMKKNEVVYFSPSVR